MDKFVNRHLSQRAKTVTTTIDVDDQF